MVGRIAKTDRDGKKFRGRMACSEHHTKSSPEQADPLSDDGGNRRERGHAHRTCLLPEYARVLQNSQPFLPACVAKPSLAFQGACGFAGSSSAVEGRLRGCGFFAAFRVDPCWFHRLARDRKKNGEGGDSGEKDAPSWRRDATEKKCWSQPIFSLFVFSPSLSMRSPTPCFFVAMALRVRFPSWPKGAALAVHQLQAYRDALIASPVHFASRSCFQTSHRLPDPCLAVAYTLRTGAAVIRLVPARPR